MKVRCPGRLRTAQPVTLDNLLTRKTSLPDAAMRALASAKGSTTTAI